MAIMGDLHLEPDQMPLFNEARQQLLALMSSADGQISPGARAVQVRSTPLHAQLCLPGP